MSDSNDNDVYKYTPSIAGAALTAAVFGILTLLHGYQVFRTRTWYFLAFWAGGIFDTVGYALRAISASQKPDYQEGIYAISQVGILVAPSLLAASMYMELGRIIRLTDGQCYAIMRVTWLTKVFVLGDVMAFLVQVMGAGMLSSNSSSSSKTGKTVIIIGLIVQVVFFALFVVTATLFHFRISHNPTEKVQKHALPWQKHLINIYACSVLVLIRCVFRLIEYSLGEDGYLMTTEWVIYVFDALLMLLVMVAFAVVHPSEVKALLNGTGLAMKRVVLTKETSLRMPMEESGHGYHLV
ncbi:hypothetical protein PRZ48_013410 [Zasmidium cellare]|uniref:Uncharacterized protein n=1 Tax=Zasmidium cellare TaxID=395010 RepID=A0ABR0E1G9_ZASCE|nr:hypothetical protein PRZ48_013410 [Zasmidium cellare]